MTKEEEILAAAEDIFFRTGYDAASTAVIAKAAGVTHAMVNYYFRSKENLFIKILDTHVKGLIASLKPLMNPDGDLIDIVTNTALAIFDRMNEDRKFPFLIQDIARTHPEFLLQYHDSFKTTCVDSIERHSLRLKKSIDSGLVQNCTMQDLYDMVFSLTTAPFLNIPILKNVAKLSDEDLDKYLQERREWIRRMIANSYFIDR